MSDRTKLETAIEKEVFKLVRTIKDHTRDFTVLYVRRNRKNIDNEAMAQLLDIVEQAIMDGFQRNVDHFMHGLDKPLKEFTSEENPLLPSDK